MKTTAVVTKNPTKETHNGLVALFAGIVVITIGVGLTLLFFTVSSATTRLYYADLIAAEQLVLQANLTVLLYEAPITLADTVILQGIIVEEQALVRQISDLIDETNCRGVETINNVTADFGNGRNFNLTGDGGINVESDGVDTLYVNATALQTQYNSEQTAITTLFDMILAAQMAIDILDGEVVKSVNHVLPDTTEHNVNFTGMCRTSVYGQALAQVAVDFCDLIAFAQQTFANVSYDFTAIDARLNQELSDMQTLLTKTNATVTQADTMLAATIFRINTVSPLANNINVTGKSCFESCRYAAAFDCPRTPR